MHQALAALAIALVVAGARATSAGAVLTGVSDQRGEFFDSPAYRALELDKVRLVVPWDAGRRSGPWDAWIERAQRDGATVMVALEHDAASRCPASPCVLPGVGDYGDALGALLARYPSIREVTAWNEPNHSSQPTFRRPRVAARYYDEARARCPACTVVAGDFLDDGGLPRYLAAYRSALRRPPAVWGLHNYYDATYFGSLGVRTMLSVAGGRLWLTETGGIVAFDPGGGGGLAHDEQRAADAVTWLYDLARRHPRIRRIYVYHWQQSLDNGFDAGLLRADGSLRPSYEVVARNAGPRGGATTSPGSRANLRPAGRFRLLAGGRLELRLRCIVLPASTGRCRGRIVLRVAGAVAARTNADVSARGLLVRDVKLPGWARRHLARARRPRVGLQVCARGGRPCTARASVSVTRSR